MQLYSDLEFVSVVGSNVGVVKQFKRALRERGHLGNRQNFQEKHVELFNNTRDYKLNNGITWSDAMIVLIENKVAIMPEPSENIIALLHKALKKIDNLEQMIIELKKKI